MTWCNMPMVTCPDCGRIFQVDDYYDLEVGDSITCAKCEKEIYILQKDTTISFRLSTESED
jgi:DNA-directed RNA polymerase subunit RPC12/RpoP